VYPQNPEVLQGIYRKDFFENFASGQAARFYAGLSKDVPQTETTVTYTSFGAVPEPAQLTGAATTPGIPSAKILKDYTLTVTTQEHKVTLKIPRRVAESNQMDSSNWLSRLGGKSSFYYDRQFVACLTSTTLLGYDGKVLYSTTHAESGSNQDNSRTAALGPLDNAADWETALTTSVGALLGFTDDQGTYVNEGITKFTILCNSTEWVAANLTVNPTMSQQAIDASGGTGKFRGMFSVIPSALVAAQTFFVFADGAEPAVGFFHAPVPNGWDLKSNMYTDSDEWVDGNIARFTGYSVFQFKPWQWKSTVKYVST
jgi:hypothetical protein